ncbi:uncharacterized protein SETTUDRAFT_167020 [Exserohilum turcica Et28A]|uniref:DUF7704 domain-containing protein n=1 Tax=Exserohilum turcicum (strain 28A) TaxID=671987 RepID=R0KLR5_EXST2|nr:uncharacterized protein SETTUDRAFT_167020 [Exserohilum turcica Et28A]EOA90054.1 hypothetical protein SETTUDRAFT_167020 [Exserohilum turcica Et28A]
MAGAVCAACFQTTYLDLTMHAPSAPDGLSLTPISTKIVLSQLANMYLGLAFLEAAVLRATADVNVWQTFLVVLLLADVGHLCSLLPLGADVYWAFWRWNAMDIGNIPFVYFLAATRICLLARVGFGHGHGQQAKVRRD